MKQAPIILTVAIIALSIVGGLLSSRRGPSNAANASRAVQPVNTNTQRAQLPDAKTVLVEIVQRGGLCPDGECRTSVSIFQNGWYSHGESDVVKKGVVNEARLRALKNAITQADFPSLRQGPFTDTCPTAYDGSEFIYTFATAAGSERFATCETVFDASGEPFRSANDIWNEVLGYE